MCKHNAHTLWSTNNRRRMFHKSRCCRCCESGIDSRQGRARHIRKQTTFFARINTHMANIGCVNFSHVVLQYQQQTTNKHRNTHTTLTNMTSVSSPNLIFNFCSTDETEPAEQAAQRIQYVSVFYQCIMDIMVDISDMVTIRMPFARSLMTRDLCYVHETYESLTCAE